VNVKDYKSESMSGGCCSDSRQQSGNRSEVFKAHAPVHFIPINQSSITPISTPVPASQRTVAPTPAPTPAESLGLMGEIGKFIGQAIETISYFANSLKKFVMGLNLFRDWFVKT